MSLQVNTVLTIGVIDSQDLPPVFPGIGIFYGSVAEHSPRGTLVDMVSLYLVDIPLLPTTICVISSYDLSPIFPESGVFMVVFQSIHLGAFGQHGKSLFSQDDPTNSHFPYHYHCW